MRKEYLTEKKEFREYVIVLASLGVLTTIPYVIERYESDFGNDFCMWNKNKNCLEEKLK